MQSEWPKQYDPRKPSLELVRPAWETFPHLAVDALLWDIGPFLPKKSFLCLEGGGQIDTLVINHLVRHAVEPQGNIRPDTRDPRGRIFHLPATTKVLRDFASLLRSNPALQWGYHLKFYERRGLLVHWHDACDGWPAVFSNVFSQEQRDEMSRVLGVEFSQQD